MTYQQAIGDPGCYSTGLGSAGAALERIRTGLLVRKLIGERRRRSAFFSGDLFADPAWDLLLALTVAQTNEHRLSISGLCQQVDVPATTALRWIGKLTSQGLFIRRDDATDRRRTYIELSPEAYGTMVAYCSTSDAALPSTA